MKKFQNVNDSLFQKIEAEKTRFIKAQTNQIFGGSGQPCTVNQNNVTVCSQQADGVDPIEP